MKFLAILRDSVREALDAKVIYFLFGLSALVMVGVASLSFRPQPAERGTQAIFNRFPGARTFGGPPPIKYELQKFEQTNDARNPWEGSYAFDLVVTESPQRKKGGDEEEEKEKAKQKEKAKPKEAEKPFLFRLLVLLDLYLEQPTEELSKEERENKKRVLPLIFRALGSSRDSNLSDKEAKKLKDELSVEFDKLTPAQFEGFIKRQIAAHGTMDVNEVSLVGQEGLTYRFRVQTKPRPETYRSWPHQVVLFFGALPLTNEGSIGVWVYRIEDNLVGGVGAGLAMLLATVVTAFFIPNMLRKGSVDLLITKPIHRWVLLVYKFIGGLAFMFIITSVIVIGVWLVLGLRTGLWSSGFLLSIFILTFQFAIFYSLSTLLGVLTRSPIVSILAACLFWGLLFSTGWAHRWIERTRDKASDVALLPRWVYDTSDTVHFILPRYKDLDILTTHLMAKDLLGPDSPDRKEADRMVREVSWPQTIGYTVFFIGLLVALACWRFSVKDY
jgi:hypothetical protein